MADRGPAAALGRAGRRGQRLGRPLARFRRVRREGRTGRAGERVAGGVHAHLAAGRVVLPYGAEELEVLQHLRGQQLARYQLEAEIGVQVPVQARGGLVWLQSE